MSDSEEWSDYNDDSDDHFYPAPELVKTISYEIVEEKDIKYRQAQAILKLSQEFDLEYSQAAVFLIQNNWNPQQVIEKILNSDVVLPELTSRRSKSFPSSENNTCSSCYCNYSRKDMIGADCCHYLCTKCYENYLTESISQGVESIFTKCPFPECKILVPQDLFKTLVSQASFERYRKFIFNSFVDNQRDVKWCPATGCTNAAVYPKRQAREIICKCGYSWCFACANETHRPLSCELLAKWNCKLKRDDSQTWLLANTKTCPKCKNSIEKNLGCMHMTCKCKYEFCWLCLGDWKKHNTDNYYDCNKFKDDRNKGVFKEKEAKQQNASYEIIRFKHYFDRYINHKSSLNSAKLKIKLAESTLNTLYSIINEPSIFDFYLEATELVYRSKLALMYTYAYGYFLESINKLSFFEFIQGELENNVIKLEGMLSTDISSYIEEYGSSMYLSENFTNHRVSVIDLTLIVKRFFNECLTQIEAGFPEVIDAGAISPGTYGVVDLNFTGVWICTICTFSNPIATNTCSACNMARFTR